MEGGYNSFGGGGGGGGGFMPGEMNSPSGGKGDRENATLRPVTVKQALDATQPYPEAQFQIDGADTASICIIGQVRNISSQSTNTTYKIDDGTGEIETKVWLTGSAADNMDMDEEGKESSGPGKQQLELNGYAKIFGRIKSFGNKRYVQAHCVRPMTDINELHCHLLEASAVHLLFTRGPPGGGDTAGGNAAAGGDAAMGGADGYAARGLPTMSPVAKRVYNLLNTEPQSNEGLHVQLIAAKLNLPMSDVARGADELLSTGVIFTTVDETTFAILGE